MSKNKRLFDPKTLTDAVEVIYTAPDYTTTSFRNLSAINTGTVPISITLYLVKKDTTNIDEQQFFTATIAAKQTRLIYEIGLQALNEGDSLRAKASTAGLVILHGSGSEQTD